MYRLGNILAALTTVGSGRSLELLRAAYERVPYAYARRRALAGLARIAAEEAAQAAIFEALWDSEEASRCIACEHVDTALPGARERLRQLAQDRFDEAEVRDAAAAALAASRPARPLR